MALWLGYTWCRLFVIAHSMARWWVTHVVGFDSPFLRLDSFSHDLLLSALDDGRCMVASRTVPSSEHSFFVVDLFCVIFVVVSSSCNRAASRF